MANTEVLEPALEVGTRVYHPFTGKSVGFVEKICAEPFPVHFQAEKHWVGVLVLFRFDESGADREQARIGSATRILVLLHGGVLNFILDLDREIEEEIERRIANRMLPTLWVDQVDSSGEKKGEAQTWRMGEVDERLHGPVWGIVSFL